MTHDSNPAEREKAVQEVLRVWKVHRVMFGGSSLRTRDEIDEAMARSAVQAIALSTPSVGVPEGWKLVPVEPTPEMLLDACKAGLSLDALMDDGRFSSERRQYVAMLAAAPTPSALVVDRGGEDQGVSRSQPCADASALALKPCPFCGGEPSTRTYETESLWSHNIVTKTVVSCDECDIQFDTEPGYEFEAPAAWNRRAPASTTLATGNEEVATAYYDGFVDGIMREPWEDVADWAALQGQEYAKSGARPPFIPIALNSASPLAGEFVANLVGCLRTARDYVSDEYARSRHDMTKDDLARIDAILTQATEGAAE